MSILIIYKSFINSLSKTINMVFSVYENMQNSARFNKKLETIKFGNTSALWSLCFRSAIMLNVSCI